MKFGQRGSGKLDKVKKRLEKRGYDMSGINTMSLSGFESLDEAMLEKLLISMSQKGGRPFTPEERATPPPPEPDLRDVEEVEVVDDEDAASEL